MDVVEVSERFVAGGRLLEFTTSGESVVVVFDGGTQLQLAIRTGDDDAVAASVDLTPAEAVALAALLTGAKVVVTHADDATDGP